MSIEEAIEAAVEKAVQRALAKVRPPSAVPDELVTVVEAGRLAGVSTATIRRWIEQGLLKRYGSARVIRVRREDVLSVRPVETKEDTDIDALAARLLKE